MAAGDNDASLPNVLLREADFCVFDLETTGFSPDHGARIIEVGAVRLRGGKPDDEFHTLVDPETSIPDKIRRLTGITDDDVRGAPRVDEVLDQFGGFTGDSVLVAHNAAFDLQFVRHYHPGDPEYDSVDTLRMARRLLSHESHSLDALIDYFGINRPRAHRGLDDARATADLFVRLMDRLRDPEDLVRCGLPPSLLEAAGLGQSEASATTSPLSRPPDPETAVLRAVSELDTAVGVNKLAGILAGSTREDLVRYQHLDTFGRLSNQTQTDLREMIEGLVDKGWLEQSKGRYPTLSLSREGAIRLTSTA